MRVSRILILLLSVTALVGACGTGSTPTAKQVDQQPVSVKYDKAALVSSMLKVDEVWAMSGRSGPSELNEVGTLDMAAKEAQQFVASDDAKTNGGAAALGQPQPLPGVTWSPVECSEMMEAGVRDLKAVQGSVRLFTNTQVADRTAGGVRNGIAATAVLNTPAANFSFADVRAKIARCRSATVTLDTFGGAVGRISSAEISPPAVAGVDGILAWRQTVSFNGLPAEALGLAALFNAEAVYMTKGDVMIWTSHGGAAGVTASQIAGPAFSKARESLHL